MVLHGNHGPTMIHRHPKSRRIHHVLDVNHIGPIQEFGKAVQARCGVGATGQTLDAKGFDTDGLRRSTVDSPECDADAVTGSSRVVDDLYKMIVGAPAMAQPICQVYEIQPAGYSFEKPGENLRTRPRPVALTW